MKKAKALHKVQSAGHVKLSANQFRVVVRFRPNNSMEEKSDDIIEKYNQSKTLSIIDNQIIQVEDSLFKFDQILTSSTTQNEAFESVAHTLCDDVMNGYNSTIFVYGQTGSGKTFTMYGDEGHIDTMGIIPKSLSCIFARLKQEKADDLLTEYSIKVSFLEIYNENLRDLLVDNEHAQKQIALKVRMNHQMHTYVEGLSWIPVENIHDVLTLIHLASTRRTVSATRMNAVSSRGHLLARFSLTKKFRNKNTVITQVADAHFADLAGSERQSKTGTSGQRLTEANHINTSLTVLGRVITALTSKNKGGKIAPFRDSKLTHILKDSLGGNCKTTLVVTGSTHAFNREETINSLKFGQRCKYIRSKMAKVNRIYTKNELLNRVSMLETENSIFRVRASEENEELQQQNNGLQLEIIKLGRMNEKTQIENDELMQRLTFLENQLRTINGDGNEEVQNENGMIDFDELKKVIQQQMIHSVQDELTESEQNREEMKKQMIMFRHEINDLKFANNCQANKVEQAEEAFGIRLEEVKKDKYLCAEIKKLVESMRTRHKSVSEAAANVSDEKRKSMEEQANNLREFAAKQLLLKKEDIKNEKKPLSKTI